MPPKRTSSFRDTGSGQRREVALPETVLESDNQMDNLSSDHTPDELDVQIESVDREFHFLNDTQRSRSSSEEKLSTPASHSRSGSLERVPENRVLGDIPRSRSSSRERSLSESSPAKTRSSSEQKTPDTDISDSAATFQQPPPQITTDSTVMHIPAFQKAPVPVLRASLRKTKTFPHSTGRVKEMEDGTKSEEDDSNQTVGTLDQSNVKQVISRYGTIPKGARIGAYLASLEQNSQQQNTVTDTADKAKSPKSEQNQWQKNGRGGSELSESRKLPMPEVTRKVEEWKAGVERSMAEEKEKDQKEGNKSDGQEKTVEHNVKPSSLFRSSSVHKMSPSAEKPTPIKDESKPVSTFLKRQKSDVGSNKVVVDNKASPTESPEGQKSPLPEWKRPKPKPSPRVQPRRLANLPTDANEEAQPEEKGKKSTIPGSFPSHNPSSSSEDVSLEFKALNNELRQQDHDALSRRLSPPVPKKPGTPQLSARLVRDWDPSKSGTDSSFDSSTDSVIDSISKNRSKWEKDSPKLDKSSKLCSPPPVSKQQHHSKIRFPFGKKDRDNKDKKSESKDKKVDSRSSKKVSSVPCSPAGSSPTLASRPGGGMLVLPPGARQVLPGSKQVLPPPQGGPTSPPMSQKSQLSTRAGLHKVEQKDNKTEKSGDEDEPVSKEMLINLSADLRKSLNALNNTTNKHSSNFLHLSEQVQTFYTSCSSYAESLPPHKNFHFRELLQTLQKISESLRTCSGSNLKGYERLLTDLENSIKHVDSVLKR